MNRYILVVVGLMLFGCTTGGAGVGKGSGENDQGQMNVKLETMRARESAGLQPVQASGDLNISVLSKGRPETKRIQSSEKTRYELHIPIGASQNMDCYLTEGMSSSAVVLKTVFDGITGVPQIASVQIKTVSADVLENMGYIYLEAEYLTNDKRYGTAKMLAASSMNASFYCTHDELGYKETFMRVAESVAKSAYMQQFVKGFSGYDKKQIDIIWVNKMSVGYAESYQFTDDRKTERRVAFSSFLVPRTAMQFLTVDSVEKSVYGKATGKLLSAEYYSYENNEEEHQIEIEQVSEKQYHVQGALKGQKFSQSFVSKHPLVYSGFLLDQYSAGKTSKKEQNFEEYVTLSPSKPVKSRIVLKEKMPNGNIRIDYSFHTAKAAMELDDKSYTQIHLNLGSADLLIKRRYFDARQLHDPASAARDPADALPYRNFRQLKIQDSSALPQNDTRSTQNYRSDALAVFFQLPVRR
jgi:hypothetical protein